METLSEEQLVKVSKSQVQFFLKVQKTNGILDEILPYKTRAELCQILSKCFWAMEFKEKKCFRGSNLTSRHLAPESLISKTLYSYGVCLYMKHSVLQ